MGEYDFEIHVANQKEYYSEQLRLKVVDHKLYYLFQRYRHGAMARDPIPLESQYNVAQLIMSMEIAKPSSIQEWFIKRMEASGLSEDSASVSVNENSIFFLNPPSNFWQLFANSASQNDECPEVGY